MKYLSQDQLEQVRRYCVGLDELETGILVDFESCEQLRIASDIALIDSNGDTFTLTRDGGAERFELELRDTD